MKPAALVLLRQLDLCKYNDNSSQKVHLQALLEAKAIKRTVSFGRVNENEFDLTDEGQRLLLTCDEETQRAATALQLRSLAPTMKKKLLELGQEPNGIGHVAYRKGAANTSHALGKHRFTAELSLGGIALIYEGWRMLACLNEQDTFRAYHTSRCAWIEAATWRPLLQP